MFAISKDNISLVEFSNIENDEEFSTYVSWVRDINNISMIGRKEYLLTMNKKSIYEYVSNLNDSEHDSFFKVYVDNVFIGTFKVGHIDWRLATGDLGIMIGNPLFRGKGWSKKIMGLGIEYAFNILNLRRLTGGCYSKNIAMCKCFEACGFVKEGVAREALIVNNEFCDHVSFGLLKKDLRKT